ncbi:MAG: sulfurtransferase TusA family protein [Porticoccaceae bacterium]
MNKPKSNVTLDTSGKSCPMPMVDINRAIHELNSGEILEFIATDQGTKMDIPSWCERTGNQLLSSSEDNNTFRYFILKS